MQSLFLAAVFSVVAIANAGATTPVDAPPPAFNLSGRVTDSTGAPIANANVVIQEAHRSTQTDERGNYLLRDVPEGTWGVSYAAIGYRPTVLRVTVRGADQVRNVVLAPSLLELAPIQVTATPLATSALESPQPLSVLQGAALQAAQAPSLGAVLEGLPGMRSFSTGNGIAKPVIRGLTGNRVLILDNGQRMETQQFGDEHGPNVETATAERIEVIRGPASVLYGSDALGGVINVVQRELPDAGGGRGFVRGNLSGGYSSNGEMPEGGLLLEGATAAIGFRGTLSGRTAGDVSTPSGDLFNSGLDMTGGSAAVGTRGGWGSLVASYTQRDERLEIHEDPEEEFGATPFQRVRANRATVNGALSVGRSRLEVDLSYERNRRREFEERGAQSAGEIALGLLSENYMANVHLHHGAIGAASGVIGVQVMRTDFEKFGEETLIPGSQTDNLGVYAFEQIDRGRWQFSAGARLDYRELRNDDDDDLGLLAGEQSWTAVTGNFGVLYRVAEPVALVANFGRGFRAPSSFELFSNGVHEGTARFEIGNPDLKEETSFNTDLALRIQSRALQAELGVFANLIDNYINPRPTGQFDAESGLQIFDIVQGDASLVGVEAALEYHVSKQFHLQGGVDFTRGQNTTSDQPLAFIAPVRVNGGVRWEGRSGRTVMAPTLSLKAEYNAKQGRLDPDDFAPDAYTLFHAGAGVAVMAGANVIRLDVQVKNLFDETYRSFLSRYKLFADDPGRNVVVRMSTTF
jgi:iron complex outermembrane receptor protein